MKKLFFGLIVCLVSGAALGQTTTRPNVSNVLTQCANNIPIVGTGAGNPAACGAGATIDLSEAQGRLTLQANTPVMATSQSAQTTLRYDCYLGANVPYFTGAVDANDAIAGCEVTDAMVSAASAGQVVANNVYDVWWVHSGANRICLAMSTAVGGGGGWSADTAGSNTARGTGYSQLDRTTRAFTTNKNSITNCFNAATNYGPVAVNQGTYLGTVYASANGQISYTFGAAAAGGTAALFGVWNMYNRVFVNTIVIDSTSPTWATTGSLTAAALDTGATGSGLNNRISFVSGIAEDGVQATIQASISPGGAGGQCSIGFGLDAVAFDRKTLAGQSAASGIFSATVSNSYAPQVGFHFIQAAQSGDGANACTIFGGTASSTGLSAIYRN